MHVLERGMSVCALGVAFGAQKAIFSDVSFNLTPGFYGLVGANGAGKTTLLRALAGEVPFDGTVRHGALAYCPQKVDDVTPDVLELAESWTPLAAELRGRLDLDGVERWPTLSPGERKRWQIAAALAKEPEVLLLDEPTNHLDGVARKALLGALRRFGGIGIIVSHDRGVLESLPKGILRVHEGKVTLHPGRYSDARAAWEHVRHEEEGAHARAKAEKHALERQLEAARRTKEARTTTTRSRMKGKNDHDARSMGAKVVAGWADTRAGRTVQVLRDALERAEVPAIERDRTIGGKVFASFERAPNAILFHVDEPELRAGDHVVLRDVRLTIKRDERIRIAGPNGAGKTTLLRALGRSDRILYLPQELEPEAIASLWDTVRALTDEERGRVLSIFAALGSDPDRLLRSTASGLSPGEARKLALSIGLGRHVWALVLDEPTNHLDLPTIERLEHALEAYPGCLVIVTHDEAFAGATVERTLHIEEGALR